MCLALSALDRPYCSRPRILVRLGHLRVWMELEGPHLEQAFAEHIRRLCRERVNVLCYLGIVLVPLFSLVDLALPPPSPFHFFLNLRLGTAAFLLLALLPLGRLVGERWPSLIGILTA